MYFKIGSIIEKWGSFLSTRREVTQIKDANFAGIIVM